ncbi:MAG: hypothetical protein U1D41_02530 [Nitrosomonas sp.]|jgi:hypothetical protein|uniref:hypothetical protein n=1 Tax=Nitrosomonas sp. TaxID=42353 RepID=UPI002AB8F7A1|nr:hypothetical protein [Nitrosomonas sp.]MDZ4105034.1 hypothetical protein [Nitrosomonas sp.]
MSDETEKRIHDEKEVQFYAAKASAWFDSRLEHDKSLLFLSAGAIGLLVTLLTSRGVNSIVLLILFFFATLSFLICLFSTLAIFKRNTKHLEDLIAGGNSNDPVLGTLDSLSICAFTIGIVLTAIIGLTSATEEVLKREIEMSKDKESGSKNIPLRESFNGTSKISPQTNEPQKKSFDGAQKVAPPKPNPGTSKTSGG